MSLECLSDFKALIRGGDYENTYKMAWSKAIVELCLSLKDSPDPIVKVAITDIAPLMIKYYWNQTIFFDLIQGSNPLKPPILLTYTKALVARFYKIRGDNQPLIFERAISVIEKTDKVYFDQLILDSADVIKRNVAYRFGMLKGVELSSIYSYRKDDDYLYIPKKNVEEYAANSQDLFDLINYRWGQILENFNSSPRINKKVRIIDDKVIKREDLKRFDKYMELENPNHICFICGKPIPEDELSRDHVIPWSYLYSDDLWNLVYVHRSCNSSKSDVIPSEADIDKLKKRNTDLLVLLKAKGVKNKEVDEFEDAINHDLVGQFFIGCKR